MYIKTQIDSISETTLIDDFYKAISEDQMLIDYKPGYHVERIRKQSGLKLTPNYRPSEIYNSIQNDYIERDLIIDIAV